MSSIYFSLWYLPIVLIIMIFGRLYIIKRLKMNAALKQYLESHLSSENFKLYLKFKKYSNPSFIEVLKFNGDIK